MTDDAPRLQTLMLAKLAADNCSPHDEHASRTVLARCVAPAKMLAVYAQWLQATTADEDGTEFQTDPTSEPRA